ncbi:MAG: hypothetical protein ACOC44_12915 [Promethearchaeia archaeon]
MTDIKCCKCGQTLDTLPRHCGQDMVFNEEKNQLECYMGPECGYIPLDEVICKNCK